MTGLPASVTAYLERHGFAGASVRALSPDASDRRYFRVAPTTGTSFVLAVLPAPYDPDALPFLNTRDLFARMPIPVPGVRGQAPDLGVMALDDLGDTTLQTHLVAAGDAERAARYAEAVAMLEVIQRRGDELASPAHLPYGLAFDVEKLMFEFRFFVTHFLEGHRRARLAGSDRAALDAEFLGIAEALSAEPRVLCHRDYHSRNLMVHDRRLWVIDFQDARMGPDTYDLVSLLGDCYVDVSDALVDDLLHAFPSRRHPGESRDARRARFDLMSVQRHLKALGTFGYQASVRSNPAYLEAVPRTLAHVRRNLYNYDRFTRLRARLTAYVDELHP